MTAHDSAGESLSEIRGRREPFQRDTAERCLHVMRRVQTMSRVALLVISVGLGPSCSDDEIDPRDVVLACRDCPPGAIRNGRMFGASVLGDANEHGDVVMAASDRVLWLHPDFSVARESELEIDGMRRLQVDAETAVVVATRAEIVVLDPDGAERLRVAVSDEPEAIALGPDHVYIAVGLDALIIGEATFRNAIVALDRTSGRVAWMVAIPPSSSRWAKIQLHAASSGELLVAGGFRGTLALGGTALPLVSSNDAGFIAMLDPAGQGQWAKALVTTDEDDRARVTAIARSTAGDVALVGSWTGPQVTLAGTTVEAGNTSGPELVAELGADGTLLRANRIDVEHISWWSSIATDGMATVVAEDRNSGQVALLGPNGWTSNCSVDALNALHAKVLAVTEVGVIVTFEVTLSGFEERPPLLQCGDVEYRGSTIAALVELVR